MISAFGVEHGEFAKNADEEPEYVDTLGKPKGWRFYESHVRDARGRYLSHQDASLTSESFGKAKCAYCKPGKPCAKHKVEKADKKARNRALKVGAAGAAVGAAVVGRGRANRIGANIGSRMASRGEWSAGRAERMTNPHMRDLRHAFAGKLKGAGIKIQASDDAREAVGRSTAAAATGGAAGTVSYQRNKKKAIT